MSPIKPAGPHLCGVRRSLLRSVVGALYWPGGVHDKVSTLFKMLLWWCWAQRQANHSSFSQSSDSVCDTLCPVILIRIPLMPTQSVSQPGTLCACGRRRTLFNKSSSVVPDRDKRGMSTAYPVCLLWMALTDWRETVHTCCRGSSVMTAYCYILSNRAK